MHPKQQGHPRQGNPSRDKLNSDSRGHSKQQDKLRPGSHQALVLLGGQGEEGLLGIHPAKLSTIRATIDGDDRLIFGRNSWHYLSKF